MNQRLKSTNTSIVLAFIYGLLVSTSLFSQSEISITRTHNFSANDFQVNDDQGDYTQGSPSIDTEGSGNFVICWLDGRNATNAIYAQRYYWDGQPVGQNFLVYDVGATIGQYIPYIAMDRNGNFVIIWNDHREGENHIYAKMFDKDGNLFKTEFRVDDDARPDYSKAYHAIGIDKNTGNFLVAWREENTHNLYDYIYAQEFYHDGTPKGTNFLASNISTTIEDLSIDSDNNGNFYIAYLWIDNTQTAIKVKKINFESGNALFNIDLSGLSSYLDCPAIAVKSNGEFIVAWEQHISAQYGNWDIYAQCFNSDGSSLGPYFQVSEDLSYDQQFPDVSVDDNGNFIITWVDKRNGNLDIYAQRYDGNGQAIGNNYRMNSDIGDSNQSSSHVSMKNGFIYSTWVDDRMSESYPDIFAKIEDWNQGTAIKVVSPNGGEVWQVGHTYHITWQSSNLSDDVRIEFSHDNGNTWSVLISNIDNDGSWDWTPQQQHISSNCLIEVGSVNDLSIKDVSDATFIITSSLSTKTYHAKRIPANMPLPSLDGILDEQCWSLANEDSLLFGDTWGQSWTNFANNLVTWRAVWSDNTNRLYVAVKVSDDIRGTFDNNNPNYSPYQPWYDDSIEFYTDGDNDGGNYDGRYDTAQQWRVSGENHRNLNNYPSASHTDFYKGNDFVTAITTNPQNGNWTCEAEFAIYDYYPSTPKQLSAGSVIGWEIWYADSDNQKWTGWCYSYDHFTGWLFRGDASSNANYFGDMLLEEDLPNLIIISPNGGEIWNVTSNQIISWTPNYTSGNVKIEYSINSGASWTTVVSSTPDDGTYSWTIPNTPSTDCLVRVSDIDGSPSDVSDHPFTIISVPGWSVPITINAGRTQLTRTFGGDASASDGFDSGLDVAAAPPGMTYYAYFELNVFPNYLETDVRKWISPYSTEINWTLKIVNASSITSNLSWNPAKLPTQGTFTLSAGNLNVDMRSQNSATITGATNVIIRYSSTPTVVYNFPQQGWYLISLPVTPPNNSLNVLFPTAMAAFSYNSISGSYVAVTFLETMKGYWLLMPSATTVTISGTALTNYTQFYQIGWHLIGSVKGTTNFSDPNDNPNGSVISAYGYNPATGQYFAVYPPGTGKLEEKEGYWLAVMQPCNLTIGSGGVAASSVIIANNGLAQLNNSFGSQPPAPPFLAEQAAAPLVPQTDRIVARNYPNPFNPETMIEYSLPQSGWTQVHIYNAMGQRIRTLFVGEQSAGVHQLRWDGRNEQQTPVADGIYFYLIITPNFRLTQKMVLLR